MNKYTRQEVEQKTIEYFKGDALASEVWINKYALKDSDGNIYELSPDDMHKRLAKELNRIEQKYPNPLSEDLIYNLLKDFKYVIPQGGPMSGIGNNLQIVSLSNCFVIGNYSDSYGGIMNTDEQQVQLMKRRGGVGHDLSHIRPKGSPVKNSALTSTGVVPFMERYSNSTREVAQDGRRGALMLSISVKHPDAEDFIDAKMTQGKVTGANVSVRLDDEFMKCVIEEKPYTQKYPIDSDNPVFTKEIDAKKLWKKIIYNAWKSAEPGLLFWDTIIKESVPDCYLEHGFKTVSTNPSLRWNTKILTKNGIFNIKDVADNNGGKVIVKNILGEWKSGVAFKSGENKQLYKITFTNSAFEVYCTPEHKWPLINTNGQIINQHTGNVLKKETKDLSRLDKIYFPQFNDVLNINKDLTEIDGFISGWNLGDGWISYHKLHKSNLYGFLFSKEDYDNNIHIKVLNYINNLNEKECNIRENKGLYEFSTSSKIIDNFFKKIGQTNKKDGLPTITWESNDNFIKGLIDGLFSSDGSVDDKRRIITYTTCHEKLAKDVHKLLSFYGIKSYLTKGTSENPFNKEKLSHRYDIRINNKSIIKFNNIFKLSNINKQNKINNIILSDNYGKYSNNSEILSNREYLVIKNVELTDIYEDVYDITVFDNTHTFQTEVGITGNCGEIPLNVGDSCRLLALNLYSYVENPFTPNAKFNYELFKEHVIYAQRFMDDIVDLEIEKIDQILYKIDKDPEPEHIKIVERELWKLIKENAIKGRRTGLGITSDGDMIAAMGLIYGTPEATDFAENVHKILATYAYKSSIIMAEERCSFTVFNKENERNNPFVNRVLNSLKEFKENEIIEKYNKTGRRNISLLTIAPTGSVSIVTQTTSGIEPVFLPSYTRRRKINPNDKNSKSVHVDEVGDHWEEYNVFHHKFKVWAEINGYDTSNLEFMKQSELDEIIKKSPYYKATSNDVDWVEKVKMQGKIQKWVDHSISVTINLPSDVTEELVSKVYQTGWESGCKGITVYRDGSRSGVLITKIDTKKTNIFQENNAPKRPESLPCDVYRFQNKGEKWIGFMGLYDNRPYEIFTGLQESVNIPNNVMKGEIKKVKGVESDGHSRYDFIYIDKDGYKQEFRGLSRAFNREFWNTGRLISAVLRHGMPLPNVLQIIDKLIFDSDNIIIISTWKQGIRRIIKKYIKEGTMVKGQICENCGSERIVFKEGCMTCLDCGTSKCD